MKEITDKKVYQCEYCGRLSLSKGGMAVHERCCTKNPSNHTPCASCEHLISTRTEIPGTSGSQCYKCQWHKILDWDTGYSECTKSGGECTGSQYKREFVCEVTGKKMYYPKKVLMMSKAKRDAIISRCDCPMPTECKIKIEEEEREQRYSIMEDL